MLNHPVGPGLRRGAAVGGKERIGLSSAVLTLAVMLACVTLASARAGAFDWQVADPQTQGMSGAGLEALGKTLAGRRTEALLIVRHDRIVYEWYARDGGRSVPHYTASMAKAIVGGAALMVALSDGRISPDDLACKYVAAWRDDPVKSRITVRHLATHSSGLQDAEHEGLPHEKLPGWMGDFWRQTPNPFLTARDDVPVLFEPGTDVAYSNPGMAMLAYCITASLKGAPETDLRTPLARRLMDPVGADPKQWSMGYGKTHELDGLKLQAVWGGGSYSPDAVARIGRLMLRRGDWDGRALVRPEAVSLVLTDAGASDARQAEGPRPCSGLGWWLNARGAFAKVPRDAFFGSGAGQQVLAVIPSLDLIAVRFGAKMGDGDFWGEIEANLLNPLIAAVDGPPCPPSPVLRGVTFVPVSEIARDAVGSDNWPITWGDDDALYAAYGDGWGFTPRTEAKLSLGFARITGPGEAFAGANIRSQTGERLGDGAQGPKAGGLLMVDGVLYMLVRNVGNSCLAWSHDHGRTWGWGFTFDTSLGCPTFLNFGPDYRGARDDYVYLYSCDGPSAYEPADAVMLARVPRGRLRDRAAYEFFVRLDEGGPVWSADLADRGPVLAYPGHCGRMDVIYNAGLKRYLMALGFDHAGGWGIFDAPEPWGPWTVAYWTADWGLGPTHSYRLPTKWISPDGRAMHLVFSGGHHEGVDYDAFCVRRIQLSLAGD